MNTFIHGKAYAVVFTVSLFVPALTLEVIQVSFNWWTDNKIIVSPQNWVLLSNEKKLLLIYTTTWINLKFIMLNARQQTLKTIRSERVIRFDYKITYIWHSEQGKTTGTGSRSVVERGWECWNAEHKGLRKNWRGSG